MTSCMKTNLLLFPQLVCVKLFYTLLFLLFLLAIRPIVSSTMSCIEINIVTNLTDYSCAPFCITCIVITVGGTRYITVIAIYSRFTLQSCSILYVTYVIFTGNGARDATCGAINIMFFLHPILYLMNILH